MANESLPTDPPGSGARLERLPVSVIMPHYNDLANLERCIAMLAAQTLPRSQYEIIVADNNSRCGLEEVRRVCGEAARVVAAPI